MHVDIKEQIWQEVKDNLVYCPDEFKKVCMRICRTSWKDHKSKIKSNHRVPFKDDPNITSMVPRNIVPTQWRVLVQYWANEEVQEIARKNSSNRELRGPPHVTGRRAFSDIHLDMTHKGERTDKMSVWKRSHNMNDPDMVAIVREYDMHLWKVPKEQQTTEY